MRFARLTNFIKQTSWLMRPEEAKAIFDIFDQHLNGDLIIADEQLYNAGLSTSKLDMVEAWNIQEIEGHKGVVSMDVDGTLVPKTYGLNPYCGMVPSQGVENVVHELDSMSEVNTLIMKVSSGGGAAQYVPETAAAIRNSNLKVISFVDQVSASGGYWFTAASDLVVATPSSILGSIGAYSAVTKKKDDPNARYETHYYQAGDKKLFGNPETPLTKAESKYFSDSIQTVYKWFTESVAEYRNVSVDEVISTQAGIYEGRDAGFLVDEVMTYRELLKKL